MLVGGVAVSGAGVVVAGSVASGPVAVGRGMTSAKSWAGPCRCAGAPASPAGRAAVLTVSVPAARMPLMVR